MGTPPSLHILGAGPAGLAAAYQASKRGHSVVILERDGSVGGLAKSFDWHGFVLDYGPHFFITNIPVLLEMWNAMLGEEQVTLKRETRVFWKGRLFGYPPQLKEVVRSLSPGESMSIAGSYAAARCSRRREASSLEEQLISRYGPRLFQMFFKDYMEKLWGTPCSAMSAEWEAGRIYRSSLWQSFRAILARHDGYFRYPLRGSRQLYEAMARDLSAGHNRLLLQTEALHLEHAKGKVQSVTFGDRKSGKQFTESCSALMSSIPLPALLRTFVPSCPETVLRAANSLSFRSTVLVYLLAEDAHVFTGQCVYLNDSRLRLGRVTNFANWSPATCPDKRRAPLCCELWCDLGDETWITEDSDLASLAERELREIGLVVGGSISDALVLRLPRTHPTYRLGYQSSADVVRKYLDQFCNVRLAGRAGAFRYSDQDEVLAAGIAAAEHLMA